MAPPKRPKKDRLDKSSKICIIGSGLGGLGAALSLEKAGFCNVTIFERDVSPGARKEGYGLTLTYNSKGPLAHMGVLDELVHRDCPSRSHYVFKPDGQIIGYFGNAFIPSRGNGQRGNLRIPRQVLRRLLMDRVVSSKVVFGKQLVGFDSGDLNKLSLTFGDGSVEEGVDLLIGADGIRSLVVKTILPNDPGPKYIGIMIILGIADFCHPLLDERGFYTLDGNHRLFTMPYEGTKIDSHNRRIMWQLSYNLYDEQEAKMWSLAGPEALRDEVLRRCQDWHDPVAQMIQSTPLETIWGTGLMDRDPEELVSAIGVSKFSNVVVLGDAAHSMSPFKGQGANQALSDGPLLASWLERASIGPAIKCFHREMADRTGVKVRASREAAGYLHSALVLTDQQEFAGIPKDNVVQFLNSLQNNKIGAWKGANIDKSIQELMDKSVETESSLAPGSLDGAPFDPSTSDNTNSHRNQPLLRAKEINVTGVGSS